MILRRRLRELRQAERDLKSIIAARKISRQAALNTLYVVTKERGGR